MKKNSDNTFLCFLAKIYFRIESYDNFNYSVPPWTTLFMIIGLIGCFFTLPLVLYKYLSDWQITWLNANDVIICLLCFWGAVVAISIALSILLVIKSGKYYKRVESYAGKDFLKQLEETRTQRSFILEVIVFMNLFFAPILINTFSVIYLCK